METTSSSKVTVEYFDPSNVFPLVSPSLLSRLPLRNLHWKSPSRPLRSIASIHVDLIPYDQSLQNGKESPESSKSDSTGDRGDTSRPSTAREQKAAQNEIAAGPSKGSTKERRHQIPGLRQNPYLKIYLLRCDDNDSYKASSRKLVREWIREHTPGPQTTSSSSNQENHDAFEWLIVHVVLPHTGASAQPRSSGNAGGAGGNEKSQSSSRWPGRGSSTILEKIKADFNGSSKSAVDRVAQIRLHKTDIPPHLLPEPSGVAYQDDDEEGAWTDLISKFKSLILTSFDLRVAQYEEDIREKDAQRSLPGWNFCTFFVLKEGLARGFESVGLVEDALVGYDELSAGLDAIAQDQASEHGADSQGGTFREFTEELWHDFKALREVQNRKRQQRSAEDRQKDQRAEAPGGLSRTSPLSVTNKKYRNLILSSNISVFDFRCYIFARQMSLLLRLANASSSRRELMAKLNAQPGVTEADFSTSEDQAPSPLRHFDEQEDLLMLAEICNRGANFITSVARIMRIDLWSACSHLKSADFESNEQPPPSRDATVERSETAQLIDYLVSFWTFSVCQQILAETSTSNLPNAFPETNKSSGKASVSGQGVQEPKTVISEPKTMIHPKRSSSLQAQPRDKERVGTFEHQQKSILSKLGMQELASSRAELWLIEKSTAEQLGRRRNWRLGWRDLSPTEPIQVKDMEDIKLDTSSTTSEVPLQHDEHHVDLSGIGNATLESALQDERSFGNLVEGLLEKILHHFEMANRRRSIAKATVELAILKFYRQDFAAAAAYFGKMIQIYAHENWDDVELTMLKMYAQCLKNLDRREDYVHIALEILAKVADKGKFSEAGHSGKSLDQAGDSTGLGLKPDEEDGMISITEYLSDLFAYSEHLSQELKIPLSRYFDGAQVDRCPRLYQDKDGVELLFKLRHLFPADLKIDRVRVKLASSVPGREIWLESNGTQTFKCGVSRIWLGTNSSSPESFYVEQILVIARNVTFIHETLPAAARSSSLDSLATNLVTTSMKVRSSLIRLFPRPEALEAKLRLSRRIHLAKPRSVELTIATGGNRVSTGELRMKSASAGLRLKLSEAKIVAGAMTGFSSSRPGIIEFGELQPQTWLRFQIPYLLEHDLAELFVRIEVAYTTEKGEFLFSRNSRVSVMLPLGVNVQDVFKKEA
ncbi:MAG: hypothetical protein M1837_004598 [Sclerophora amabilis]|nr:MAG: hypothetical protein M1837_004598 [Sclerophora amabilis]